MVHSHPFQLLLSFCCFLPIVNIHASDYGIWHLKKSKSCELAVVFLLGVARKAPRNILIPIFVFNKFSLVYLFLCQWRSEVYLKVRAFAIISTAPRSTFCILYDYLKWLDIACCDGDVCHGASFYVRLNQVANGSRDQKRKAEGCSAEKTKEQPHELDADAGDNSDLEDILLACAIDSILSSPANFTRFQGNVVYSITKLRWKWQAFQVNLSCSSIVLMITVTPGNDWCR